MEKLSNPVSRFGLRSRILGVRGCVVSLSQLLYNSFLTFYFWKVEVDDCYRSIMFIVETGIGSTCYSNTRLWHAVVSTGGIHSQVGCDGRPPLQESFNYYTVGVCIASSLLSHLWMRWPILDPKLLASISLTLKSDDEKSTTDQLSGSLTWLTCLTPYHTGCRTKIFRCSCYW